MGFPLVLRMNYILLRMNHILFQYNLEENTIRKEEKKKSEFCFKSKVTKKLSPRICILSFKALWKTQDLGPEEEALHSSHVPKLPLSAVVLSFRNIAIRSRELTEEILFA